MKKIIAFTLVFSLMLMACTGVFAASFSDLEGANWSWARDIVSELSDKGIVKGYSDGTFKPSNIITNQEAFTLFARIVGVNDEVNKDAVDAAQSLYASVAARYNTYASKELCYMLYRGIFTENELDTYLSESTKNNEMKRHEAAILITKIMGGQQEVQNTVMYVFDFKDADEIPAASKGYVDFVNKKGIMQGMDDNTFSPNTGVTRAQVAVMLKKTMDTLGIYTVNGEISEVDQDAKTVVVDSVKYSVNENTIINIDGAPSDISHLKAGDSALITISVNGVWAIDAKMGEEKPSDKTEKVEAIFSSSVNDTRGTFIKAYNLKDGASSMKDYKLSDSVLYTYNGAVSNISSLSKDDRIYITLTNDLVTAVDGESKTKTITDAYVESIVLEPVPSIKISHLDSAYNGKSYEVYSGVYVMRNKRSSSLRDILIGDRATLKVEYDTITSIEATSQMSTMEGTIEEITIGKNISSIKLSSGGQTDSYAIMRDTEIIVDGQAATIYDLKLDYAVGVNIESDTVTKIEVRSVAQPKSITGTVVLVNTSLGFINLSVTDTLGNITTQQVFIKTGASIIGSSTGSRKSISDLKAGDMLMITGESNMGAYEANTIILLENN